MAKFNNRHVDVSRAPSTPEEKFIVSSPELGTKTVNKSQVVFTEEEKARFLKEDAEKAKTHPESYKTQADIDKMTAETKALAKKHQDEIDARNYKEMSAEDKAAWDKAHSKPTTAEPVKQPEHPVTELVQQKSTPTQTAAGRPL